MRIECTIRRSRGTNVTFRDGTRYRFAPSASDPRHTANVDNDDHIAEFLKIKAYRIARDAAAAPVAPPPAPPADDPPPEKAAPPPPPPSKAPPKKAAPAKLPDLDKMTKGKLVEFAKERGITVDATAIKPIIIEAITTALKSAS